jgi:hypothetical protein
MTKIKFNKHYVGKCYINFYNKEYGFLENLIHDLKQRLNYKDGRGDIETSEVKMYLICKGGYFFWSGFEPDPNEGYINCGDNADMFLAIAALRDDTDDFQWLTNDTHTYWERKETTCLPSKYMQLEGHKATLEEIVENFKEEL